MQKFFCSKLFLLLVSFSSLLNGSSLPVCRGSDEKMLQTVPRRRSPLALEKPYTASVESSDSEISDGEGEDVESSFNDQDEQEKIQKFVPLLMPQLPISTIKKLQHRLHNYEVTMQYAPIEKCSAVAVINPYSQDPFMPRSSFALYKKSGAYFCQWFREYQEEKWPVFVDLKKRAGNTHRLPLRDNSSGELPIFMMALMYVPQSVQPKQIGSVVKGISDGLSVAICDKLYPVIKQYDISGANVVLPAIGSDTVYKGYPGGLMAKVLLQSAVKTLRFLHVSGHPRLKTISFMIDNDEAFRDYTAAFNEFYKAESDFFYQVEQQGEIQDWY